VSNFVREIISAEPYGSSRTLSRLVSWNAVGLEGKKTKGLSQMLPAFGEGEVLVTFFLPQFSSAPFHSALKLMPMFP